MIDAWIMTSASSRRAWLASCLGADPAIHLAGMASNFALLRSSLQESTADVAVIEPQTESEMSDVRNWLSQLMDMLPTIILQPEPDHGLSNRILQAGAGGMLRSTASAEQIILAVKSVAAGLIVLDGNITAQGTGEMAMESLTPRENEVLHLLADGLGNKEIASQLHISEHTIKFHIGSILSKLGASSRTEAVSRGLRSGLIEL